MNQVKLITEIGAALPELEPEINENANRPFALVRAVTWYTRKMIEQHNEVMINKCMKIVGSIYTKGDAMLKNAVADVFVFSLDTVLTSCNLKERKKLINILPENLRAVYLKQVYSSGI